MTDRENIIGMLRRTGYERLMPYFQLTPDLQKRFTAYCRETGYVPPTPAMDELPHMPPDIPREDAFWKPFYDHNFKEGTTFSAYGVAMEPGSRC